MWTQKFQRNLIVLISPLDSLKPCRKPASVDFYGKLWLNFHLHGNILYTQNHLSAQHWQKIRWREGNENSKFLKMNTWKCTDTPECLSQNSKIFGSWSQTPITAEKNTFNILSEEAVKNLLITTVMACTVLNCYPNRQM